MFKLFNSMLDGCIDRILAANSLELCLGRYPLRRQKFETPLKTYHRQECDELRYPQLAMAEVKSQEFKSILREK